MTFADVALSEPGPPEPESWWERAEPWIRGVHGDGLEPVDLTTAERDGAEATRRHSWLPVPLLGTPPVEPPSIAGLLYPGKRHLLSGRSDSGKSMLVHLIEAEQIRQGECVVHVDFEQGRAETLQRLLALGLTEAEIEHGFLYVAPADPIGDLLPDVLALIAERAPTVVAFDSLGNLAELHGLDDNRRGDIDKLFRAIITPIAKAGPAAVYLDHLPKDPDASDVFPIGSERKLGLSDVHLRTESSVPLGRGRKGIVRVLAKRDRSGYLRRGKIAEAVFDSDTSGRISARLDLVAAADDDSAGKVWRPTHIMQEVSQFLEGLGEPGASMNAIESGVPRKRDYVRQAVTVLVADGYASERQEGPARIITSTKPYRQAE